MLVLELMLSLRHEPQLPEQGCPHGSSSPQVALHLVGSCRKACLSPHLHATAWPHAGMARSLTWAVQREGSARKAPLVQQGTVSTWLLGQPMRTSTCCLHCTSSALRALQMASKGANLLLYVIKIPNAAALKAMRRPSLGAAR